ncbi:hypothetical protein B0H19DRAFT_72729 [Mycena capillaripes]|nr:hypothetical protein B0H19DRAFT_72729 [Mycena capillaripes]
MCALAKATLRDTFESASRIDLGESVEKFRKFSSCYSPALTRRSARGAGAAITRLPALIVLCAHRSARTRAFDSVAHTYKIPNAPTLVRPPTAFALRTVPRRTPHSQLQEHARPLCSAFGRSSRFSDHLRACGRRPFCNAPFIPTRAIPCFPGSIRRASGCPQVHPLPIVLRVPPIIAPSPPLLLLCVKPRIPLMGVSRTSPTRPRSAHPRQGRACPPWRSLGEWMRVRVG